MITKTSWNTGIDIEFDIQRWKISSEQIEGLLVNFSGEYINSESKKEAATFMRMAVIAAFAWPRNPGVGLVVDISKMKYSSGDRLFYWRTALLTAGLKRGKYPIAVVWSPMNEVAIRTLLEDEEDEEMLKSCFSNVDDAIMFIRNSALDV